MLQGMRASIDEDLAKHINPKAKILEFNRLVKKYKHDFAEEHEKEIKDLAQQFGGNVIN
jgi:hypothetical protein